MWVIAAATPQQLPTPPYSRMVSFNGNQTRRIHEWVRTLAVLGLFVMLTVILLYPLSVQFGDHLPDRGDPLENTWVLASAGARAGYKSARPVSRQHFLSVSERTWIFGESGRERGDGSSPLVGNRQRGPGV